MARSYEDPPPFGTRWEVNITLAVAAESANA